MTIMQIIKQAIEKCLDDNKDIAIYPLGALGLQTKLILKEIYGMEPTYVFDNQVCNYNKKVLPFNEVYNIPTNSLTIIYTMAKDNKNYGVLRKQLLESGVSFIELNGCDNGTLNNIGKYSYGDLCHNAYFVESIGAFSSFAEGAKVVQNHATQY